MRPYTSPAIGSIGLLLLLGTPSATSVSPLVAARGKEPTKFAKRLQRRQDFPSADTSINYCRFFDHQSVKVGDKIFVEGGAFTEKKGSNEDIYLNPGYVSIDFSSAFDLPLKSDSVNVNTDITYPEGYPLTWLGALWSDGENKVYKYGGFFPDNYSFPTEFVNVQANSLYELDISSSSVNKIDTPSDITRAANGAYLNAPEINSGFWLGGFISNNTDTAYNDWPWPTDFMALDSLLTFDTKAKTWKNTTADFNPRSAGELVHVPSDLGSGYLVQIGGLEGPKGIMSTSATNADFKLAPMDDIQFYDIDNERWLTQKATGDIPSLRQLACTVLAIAEDRSSYNIILHGGANWGIEEAYGDIYVLSLPSFRWIKMDSGSGQTRRMAHTCHLMGDNQMAVIGGRDVDQFTYLLPGEIWGKQGACDPMGFVNILNLNMMTWANNFDPDYVGYEVHDDITAVIGGDFLGGATETSPQAGWDDEELGYIFEELIQPNTSPSKPKPKSNGKNSGPGLGVIIGAAVGGVVVLCIIASLIWYFCRRKRSSPTPTPAPVQQPQVTQIQQQQPLPQMQQPSYPGPGPNYPHPQGSYYQPVYPGPNQSSYEMSVGAAYPQDGKATYNPHHSMTPQTPAPVYSPYPHMLSYSNGQSSFSSAPPPPGVAEVYGSTDYSQPSSPQQQPVQMQQSPMLTGTSIPASPQSPVSQPSGAIYSELPDTGSNNQK